MSKDIHNMHEGDEPFNEITEIAAKGIKAVEDEDSEVRVLVLVARDRTEDEVEATIGLGNAYDTDKELARDEMFQHFRMLCQSMGQDAAITQLGKG